MFGGLFSQGSFWDLQWDVCVRLTVYRPENVIGEVGPADMFRAVTCRGSER